MLVLYSADTDVKAIIKVTDELAASGKSVSVRKSIPERLKYRAIIDLREDSVKVTSNRQ